MARELVKKRGLHFDYGVLGDALMEQGKLDEAVVAYQAMMDQKPSPQAYSRAAHMRWLKGDLLGAIELMSWAAGVSNPRDPESAAWTSVRLARYKWQAGDTKSALELIDEALALQPEYPPALLERGRVLLALDKTTEAIEVSKRAAVLNPLPEYQWTLSEALRAADRVGEAQAIEAQLRRRGAADESRTFSLYLATRGEDVPAALTARRKWNLKPAPTSLPSTRSLGRGWLAETPSRPGFSRNAPSPRGRRTAECFCILASSLRRRARARRRLPI